MLWFNGNQVNEIRKDYVSAKDGLAEKVHSAKDADVYSAKGAKVPIEIPDILKNPLDRPIIPIFPPMPPINPPPVTNVNP